MHDSETGLGSKGSAHRWAIRQGNKQEWYTREIMAKTLDARVLRWTGTELRHNSHINTQLKGKVDTGELNQGGARSEKVWNGEEMSNKINQKTRNMTEKNSHMSVAPLLGTAPDIPGWSGWWWWKSRTRWGSMMLLAETHDLSSVH